MSRMDFLNASPPVFIEAGSAAWKVLAGDAFAEIPVESLAAGLDAIVKQIGAKARGRAYIALPARGISLRRMSLPPVPIEELPRVLRLQIENEFPLPPDELAWGWQALGERDGKQDVLVAAVKKELLASIAATVTACGWIPVFTPAALARAALCTMPAPNGALLQLGATESELLTLENGHPNSLRVVPRGAKVPVPAGGLFVVGDGARELGQGTPISADPGNARTLALAGLKKLVESKALVELQTGAAQTSPVGDLPWPWIALAAALAMGLLFFPYLEAIALQPHLTKKIASLENDRKRLPAIDRELEFLQYIKRSQPPYLEAVYLMSKLAPQGANFESINMTRRGELSLHGKFQNGDQVTQLRSNMIQSAWFSTVVVEEQTTSPDRKVAVRLTAQLKPVDARKPIADDPPEKAEKK